MMLGRKRKRQALSLAAKLEIISKLEYFSKLRTNPTYGQIPLTGTLRSQDARLREVRVYFGVVICSYTVLAILPLSLYIFLFFGCLIFGRILVDWKYEHSGRCYIQIIK